MLELYYIALRKLSVYTQLHVESYSIKKTGLDGLSQIWRLYFRWADLIRGLQQRSWEKISVFISSPKKLLPPTGRNTPNIFRNLKNDPK